MNFAKVASILVLKLNSHVSPIEVFISSFMLLFIQVVVAKLLLKVLRVLSHSFPWIKTSIRVCDVAVSARSIIFVIDSFGIDGWKSIEPMA